MADPSVVNVVIEELKGRGIREGASESNRFSVGGGRLRDAVSKALDAGFDGPTIVNFTASYDEKTAIAQLDRLATARQVQVKAEQEAQRKEAARAEAGFAPAAPTPAPASGGSPAAPAARAPSTNAVIQWMQKRFGLTADQATVALADDVSGFYLKSFMDETEPQKPSAGFAPQAKSSGMLPSGRPYIFNPNAAPGSQFSDGITGGALSPADFAALPQQVHANDGYLYYIDPATKAVTKGPLVGFAGIDPAITAAEGTRQFDVAEGGRNARNTQSEQAANQRQQLSSQTAGFQSVNSLAPALGNLALDNAKFTKDTLSSPADFLARAFFQRGQTSPLPQVSQADVINQLRNNIAGFQGALSTYGNTFPGFTTSNTAAAPSPAAPSASAGFGTPSTGVQPGPQTAPQAGFESIQFNPQTQQWTQNGKVVNAFEAAAAMQAAPTPPAAPVGITAAPAPAQTAAPAQPWGAMGFAAPTLPTPAPVTQAELQSLERANRPPAINDVLGGKTPTPIQFGFQLPTPRQLDALTPDEKKAFGTTLATQYNTTLDDVGFAVDRRFRNPETRRRATVAGFASGGITTDEKFIGNEDGAELYLNPTGAPIQVVDAETTRQLTRAGGTRPFDRSTDRNRLLGRRSSPPAGPLDPTTEVLGAHVLSPAGRSALDAMKDARSWTSNEYANPIAGGPSTVMEAAGHFTPATGMINVPRNKGAVPEAVIPHEFAHAMRKGFNIDLDEFDRTFRDLNIIESGDQEWNRFLSGYNSVPKSEAAPQGMSEVNRAVWGGGQGKPDPEHLYTALVALYGGRAYEMPERLRKFYPWLKQMEGEQQGANEVGFR